MNLTRQKLAILGSLLLAGYLVFCCFGYMVGRGAAPEQAPPQVHAAPTWPPTWTPTPRPTDTPKLQPTDTPTPPPAPPETPLPTDTPTPSPPLAKVTAPTLNVRAGPDTAYATIGKLSLDDSVEVVGRNAASDWLQIVYPANSDRRGWIAADDAKLTGPMETLPEASAAPPPEPAPLPTDTAIPPTDTPAPVSPPVEPTATPQQVGNCDPAYPDVCIPPPPRDLDCKDVPYRRFRVLPPDPHRFDGDHDDIGCER